MAKASDVDQLILEALERALADPKPRKLHGTKAIPGIFLSASATTKAAASRCLEQGLVRQVAEQRTGKRLTPLFAIAPAGVALALERSPVPRLLAAMLDAVARTARSVAECSGMLQAVGEQAEQLRKAFEQATARLQPPDTAKILEHISVSQAPACAASAADHAESLDKDLVSYIRTRRVRTPLQPVELPELFRHAAAKFAPLSVGQFHDAVRRLAGQKRMRLLPFTQAMYQLAEPEYALILGREIMYYAEPGSNSTSEQS
jgi:hypothetical protein